MVTGFGAVGSEPRHTQLVWVTDSGALLHVISSSHRFRGYLDFHEIFVVGGERPAKKVGAVITSNC